MRQKNYYPILDVFRILAISLVLLRHILRPFIPGEEITSGVYGDLWLPLRNIMANGWIGVDLFFVLSGFLIFQTFFAQKENAIMQFYKNRAFRILPAYFAVLLLVFTGFFPFYELEMTWGWKDVFPYFIFMQDYTGSPVNVVYWSLAVEIKFYLIAPFVFLILQKYLNTERSWAVYFILFIVISIPIFIRYISLQTMSGLDDYYAYFRAVRSPFHASFDSLFIGVLVAVVYRRLQGRLPRLIEEYSYVVFILSVLVMTGLASSHVFLEGITFYDVVFQPIVIGGGFAAMMLSGLFAFKAMKKRQWVDWGARLSYSVYLVHWPLIPICLLIPQLFGVENARDNLWGFVSFGFVLTIISFAMAWIIYVAIEKPFLQLRKK